jgi:hypothetical protein
MFCTLLKMALPYVWFQQRCSTVSYCQHKHPVSYSVCTLHDVKEITNGQPYQNSIQNYGEEPNAGALSYFSQGVRSLITTLRYFPADPWIFHLKTTLLYSSPWCSLQLQVLGVLNLCSRIYETKT